MFARKPFFKLFISRQADEEVAAAQRDFDRQLGVVRHLAEGILSSQVSFPAHLPSVIQICERHCLVSS